MEHQDPTKENFALKFNLIRCGSIWRGRFQVLIVMLED
jgi:hypothetical protein